MIKNTKRKKLPIDEDFKQISLIDFVEFIHTTGTNRISHVRKLKKRDEYDPKTDFWLKMRNSIISHQARGDFNLTKIETMLESLKDPKKRTNYNEVFEGYKKFIKRHKGKWCSPPKKSIFLDKISLNINPEIGLKIGNKHVLIKLYFKKEPITNSVAKLALIAMDVAFAEVIKEDLEFEFKLLDVRRNRLYTLPKDTEDLKLIFEMEADNFVSIYQAVTI